MSSFVARERIEQIAKKHREHLVEKFKDIEYFSATSDIYTRSNRSYIAVSVHYIDPRIDESVQTHYIACELFEGSHTNDRIAAKLSAILSRFGLLEKVFFITTDGDAKYVAAFKYFGNHYRTMSSYLSLNGEWLGNSCANADGREGMDVDDDEDDLNNSDAEAEDLQNMLIRVDSDVDDTDSEFDCDEDDASADNIATQKSTRRTVKENDIEFTVRSFSTAAVVKTGNVAASNEIAVSNQPILGIRFKRVLKNINRIACSSHALDKVGSKDAKNAKENSAYRRMYNAAMGKVKQLWRLKRKRTKAETFKQITGRNLIGPHSIRWLSKFDAVSIRIFCAITAEKSE